jgi:microcystin degradation protein MlrC
MRVFLGGISTETNTFSPLPVGLAAFEQSGIHRGDSARQQSKSSWAELHRRIGSEKWHVTFGLLTDTPPGAPVAQIAYEYLRDQMLDDIRVSLPFDIILLDLHGGMVAYGYDDCEGDLIQRIRSLVGPNTVIGARLDPHCHLTNAMTDNATLIACFKENPHTDIAARGDDLVRLAADAASGRTRPVMSIFDCRMADVFQTNREPMKSFVARLRAMEGKHGILDISIAHGFRRADIPYMGAKTIVITDGRPAEGAVLAEQLGRELYSMRGTCVEPHTDFETAMNRAVNSLETPVLLADMPDNPGGGSPGDSTYIFAELLKRGERNFAIGYMCDPLALKFAMEAGEGATLSLRIGGKACALSGDPIDLQVTVRKVIADAILHLGQTQVPMGPAVWISHGDIDIVLIERRIQTYGPQLFLDLGVDLKSKKIIVVKSAQHYRAWFGDYMAFDMVVDAPGVCTPDVLLMTFHRIPRPLWPFDDDPWAETAK